MTVDHVLVCRCSTRPKTCCLLMVVVVLRIKLAYTRGPHAFAQVREEGRAAFSLAILHDNLNEYRKAVKYYTQFLKVLAP